jgi:D-glycero-alpha-D-manno-heptose-7-phosphate kinase
MGTSSSFTVGLLHALYAMRGTMPTKQQLALDGIHVEQELLRETVGSQDQVLAAYGGLNHITFLPNGGISVRPVTITAERIQELNHHLMLFFTGIQRTASQIAESYVAEIDVRRRQLRVIKDLVEESIEILHGGHDILGFGDLLHEAWQIKRSLSARVSTSRVDELYDVARAAGAIGGKLTGAGGGGFLLLFVPPERHAALREALRGLIYVPFKFEFSGSQIILFDPEEDYSAHDPLPPPDDAIPALLHAAPGGV